ncbi:hypothetical protein H4217_006125 [Coemansia sp. RSA 1939]|nr:hypothetical protein H4217_006125 [Coemansia sp. RSA 1939]
MGGKEEKQMKRASGTYVDEPELPSAAPMSMPVPAPIPHGPMRNSVIVEGGPVRDLPPAYHPPQNPQGQNPGSYPHGMAGSGPQQAPAVGMNYVQPTGPPILECPYCKRKVPVYIEKKMSGGTICLTVTLCVVFWPVALIPLLSDSFKNDFYHCGVCHSKLGKTKELGSQVVYAP